MRNLDTDELVLLYKDGTTIVIDAGEMGEIALSREDAEEMARQIQKMIKESE